MLHSEDSVQHDIFSAFSLPENLVMIRRTYSGEADLKLLQDFNAAAIAATDHCGYLHPGDIPHHLFNGNHKYDPAEVMTP